MWNRWKPYIGCLLGYTLVTNIFLAIKQQNLVTLMTVPGMGLLSAISRSFVFNLSDKLGVFFYSLVGLITALFLFIPMLIYGFHPKQGWIGLQIAILVFDVLLFFYK
jgi:hypothetical protein